MLACISKNDRAEPLFNEVAKLIPGTVQLGRVIPSRGVKLMGALTSLSTSLAQIRTDMEFSPVIGMAGKLLTKERLRSAQGVTHVLQWGAMYAPVEVPGRVGYSIVTDGPFDPMDALYPMEWKPKCWAKEYFARQRVIYREASLVFTLSEWARQKLLTLHGIDPHRVVRIGWGPMFEAVPTEDVEASKTFVSIGNEWRRKGMDLVARAGSRLHAEDGEVVTVIVGDPEGMRIAATEGVTLIPHRVAIDEVEALLRTARALVVASRFDASPHIISEALQMGLPVIGSNVCGIPEAVQAPLGGVVIPVGNESELMNAMRGILREEQTAQRTGALKAFAVTGGWPAAAQRIADALQRRGVLAPNRHLRTLFS